MRKSGPSPERDLLPTAVVAFAAILFATTAYFGRILPESGLAPAAVAFYRFALVAMALLPFARFGGAPPAAVMWAFAAGIGMGLGWIGFVEALRFLPVAETAVLFMTYPLFTIALAALLFQERPTGRGLAAAGLVIVAAIVATPVTGAGAALLPVALGLCAPLAYGFLLNVVARKVAALAPLTAVVAVAAGAAAGVLPLVVALPVEAVLPRGADVALTLIAFAGLSALLPQLLFSVFVPRIGAVRTAIAGSVELPTMFVIGLVAFGEPVGLGHVAGAVLIALAIGIGTRTQAPLPQARTK
jgi:drug/metabolite transporter (DMT)-like permease